MLNLRDNAEARLWYFNLSGLLLAMLLGSVIGPISEAFPPLILGRFLAAVVLTLLPQHERIGALRPYFIAAGVATLATLPLVDARSTSLFLAVLALFLIVDPGLDALLASRSPETEWLGRVAQLILARVAGLFAGLFAHSAIEEHPDWVLPFYSATLVLLLLIWTAVSEGPDEVNLLHLGPHAPRMALVVDALKAWGSADVLASTACLIAVALLASSFTLSFAPLPLLSDSALRQWYGQPGYRLGVTLACAVVALLFERLSRQTLITIAYPALLIAAAARIARPRSLEIAIALEVVAALSLLTAYRQCLVNQARVSPLLRAALPATCWTLALLAGPLLRSTAPDALSPMRIIIGVILMGAVAHTLRSWQTSVRIKSSILVESESDLRARGQGLHGDKTLDFSAAPEGKRRYRSRWLVRLWYLLTVRFPVTITLAAIAGFLIAGVWQAHEKHHMWRERTYGVWVALKTELFMTSLKRRLEEEMLASNRVPRNWPQFVATNFELDGRPMKDRDFWGSPLRFEVSAKKVRIVSAGPDKVMGTADDLERVARRPQGST